jgi:hypothetical protein
VSSIFVRAMGSDFERLHPQLQRRFGLSSAEGRACIGRGVMDRIWRGGGFTTPFLRIGAWRNILVPTTGTDVPFTIENYAYVDGHGRETVAFVRTFELSRARRGRFGATMVYSESRRRVIDYLGTHQHLAVDLDLAVDGRGGLVLRSGDQRFYEGWLAFRFPLLASGVAELHESYDEAAQRFRIDVRVTNRRFGPLFGYTGSFTCVYTELGPAGVPSSVKPLREERRD